MSAMDERAEATDSAEALARYKAILQRVIANRPSGTRQRLAGSLGKNPSFISQITNPAYPTPIPARHLETIFEICHFSPDDRQLFLDAYTQAHPRRLALHRSDRRVRAHTIYLPDLGDQKRNHELDQAVGEFVQRLTRLIDNDEET